MGTTKHCYIQNIEAYRQVRIYLFKIGSATGKHVIRYNLLMWVDGAH